MSLEKVLREAIFRIMGHAMGNHPANFQRFHRFCPQCGGEMVPDVILDDGRGLRVANIQVPTMDEVMDGHDGKLREPNGDIMTAEILGEGSYCESCQRGWTIGQLFEMQQK